LTKISRLPWVPHTLTSLPVLTSPQSRSQTQSLTQATLSPDLQIRDRELTEIAKSIASLAELFKDLSVLVIDQGTLLDSVEYNIEQTAVQVQDAVKELTLATR
jgi:syntaxin 16